MAVKNQLLGCLGLASRTGRTLLATYAGGQKPATERFFGCWKERMPGPKKTTSPSEAARGVGLSRRATETQPPIAAGELYAGEAAPEADRLWHCQEEGKPSLVGVVCLRSLGM